MRNCFLSKVLMVLFFIGCIVIVDAAEAKWTSGALPVADSMNEVSTTSKAKTVKTGVTEFSFSFANKMSNSAYVQFPMSTNKVYAQIAVPIRTRGKTCNVELWLENAKGWKYQKTFKVTSKDWNNFEAAFKGMTSDKVKNARLIVPNKGNPKKGVLFLRSPEFIDQLILDKKVTKELKEIKKKRLEKKNGK